MHVDLHPCDIPVLLLFDLDPFWSAREREEAISLSSQLCEAISAVGHPTLLAALTDTDLTKLLSAYDPATHIVFNWCESIPGIPQSESLVSRTLESFGFAFTGASSRSLALTQDKYRVKKLLDKWNLPVPEWRLYDRAEADGWNRFPAIVKPANEHCSVGITRESVVITERELIGRISFILETYRQPALVEDFIDGREFHVSLWGNGRIEMLPPAEMDFSLFSEVQDRLCTYDSKFTPGSLHYEGIQTLLPAQLKKEELRALEEASKAAYAMAGCRDYGRIDLRIRDGVFFVLDVNPNADISMDASLACAAEFAGYSYGETGSRIIRLAARRHPIWGGND